MNRDTLRLDKWFWYARFIKSRSLATKLCNSGKVRVNGNLIKKAHQSVTPGDVLTFSVGPNIRVIKIIKLGNRRGPAKEAQALYEDLQPIDQIAKKIGIDLNCSNINSAKTPSYPSGHTAQSLLIANVLGDLYPKHKDNLLRVAEEISKSRMVGKVHFPSDVKFGKKIGIALYKQYKKNGN